MREIATVDREFYKKLGKQLRIIREEKNMTMKEVAEETGFSRTLIDLWELGRSKIKPYQLKKICNTYDIDDCLKIEVKISE